MMKALILICAIGVPRADCSIDTALDIIQGPEVGSFGHCAFMGQAYIADTAIAGALDGEHYLKVVCTSREPVGPDVRQADNEADRLDQASDGRLSAAIP
ncbi:MAG: hypothetical protein AAF543_10090 [Pseudomonadota bacterium]